MFFYCPFCYDELWVKRQERLQFFDRFIAKCERCLFRVNLSDSCAPRSVHWENEHLSVYYMFSGKYLTVIDRDNNGYIDVELNGDYESIGLDFSRGFDVFEQKIALYRLLS